MSIRSNTLPLLALFFILSLSSCAALFVGAATGAAAEGGVAYYMGDLKSTEKFSAQYLSEATNKAFKDLKIARTGYEEKGNVIEFTGRRTDDIKVTVKIEKIAETESNLSIRVGVFGDREASQQIYDTIHAHL